jgi:recombinational DNA repair ATPase RecF
MPTADADSLLREMQQHLSHLIELRAVLRERNAELASLRSQCEDLRFVNRQLASLNREVLKALEATDPDKSPDA